MLAISQIEVAVKSFWGDIYHKIPKFNFTEVSCLKLLWGQYSSEFSHRGLHMFTTYPQWVHNTPMILWYTLLLMWNTVFQLEVCV